MIFGKYISRYYLCYGWMLLLGLFALIMRCMRYRGSDYLEGGNLC